MSYPFSSNSQDPSYSPTSTSRNARVQQSAWGPSSQQQAPRRGLTPLSTGQNTSQIRPGTSSPSRNAFSPTSSTFGGAPAAGRQVASRHSSNSSTSSLFSPLGQAAAQTAQTRSRNVTSSGSPLLTSTPFSSHDRGLGSSGGPSSRFARQSPSLSLSTTGSPSSGPQSAGSGQITSLVITQLNILLSTLKEDKDRSKWETQAEKIWKLIDEHGMEVFTQYFRRLLQSNASQIFPASGRPVDGSAGTYQLLVNEMQKLTTDKDQASKIADAIDTNDGDLFRDFDLSTFMDHFRLNPIARTSLALACKGASKTDLRTKADTVLSNSMDAFTSALYDPIESSPDLSPDFIAALLGRLAHNPPRLWNDEKKTGIQQALLIRYKKLMRSIPYAVEAAMCLLDLTSGQAQLVRLLQQAGPSATQSLETCKDMLTRADSGAIVYYEVANALLYTAMASDGEAYDPSVLVSALRQHRTGQRLDWQDVVSAFDRKEVRVTKQQFLALYNALLPLAREYENFDIQALWGNVWNNLEAQLSFVVAFLSCTAAELDVSQIPRLRTAFSVEEFTTAADDVKEYATKAVNHPMVSYDATQALFSIIFNSQEAYNVAQSLGIPEVVINVNTDIFICAASAVTKPWAQLQEQALRQLFYPFFHKQLPHYDFVMEALWAHDKTWLAARLIDAYNGTPRCLPLIFEHAEEHNWIDQLAQVRNDFGLDFAALAHGQGLLDLDKWAHDHIQNSGVPASELSRAIITFLQFKMDAELAFAKEAQPQPAVPLKLTTVYALLNVIQGTVSERDEGQVQRQCIQAYPRLINYGYKFDHDLDANNENGNALSPEADAKMQEQYKDMYGGDSDARKMINTLRTLKESEDPADQELFAAMISGLFDEYNCFGEYPLEALATTAVLFGSIINFGILHSRITLSVALFMVVEAVAEYSPNDSMYKFGLQALIHCQSRLEEWPQLCERLCRMPGLRGTEVQAKAEEIARREGDAQLNGDADNPLALTNGIVEEAQADALYQPFSSITADAPLRPDLYEVPDEDTSDKVMFVLNNVSKRNLAEKFKDLQSALEDRHHQWFASYLVEDLAKMQPNFQALYLDMLGLFNTRLLWQEVLRETYVSVSRIINNENTLNSSTDRAYLKNLAGWLGLLTLARDQPVLHRNISFKDLLIEAHQTQRLIIAIPFTCKVLAQAARSPVFRPPNPWTMELLGMLMELYHFAELKLNLKFEIEVLCKELDLDHKVLEPLDIIRSLPHGADESFMQPYPSETVDGFGDMLGLTKRANERFSTQEVMKTLPDLNTALNYPPAPGNVSQQQMRNVFFTAAQRAIQEIIAPVVDRSVTIAAISTSQLVVKDFATEVDFEKMRQSAYNVVKALSGSLALVTCKEPLRSSINNHSRVLANSMMPGQLPEGSILMFINDNLDAVCKLIEDCAENHSLAEVDAHLEEASEARKAHQQQRPNEPFNNPAVSRWAYAIPAPYAQNENGLNAPQLAIYEDFGRHVRVPSASHMNNVSQDAGRQLPDVLTDSFLPNLPTPAEAPRQPVQQQQRIGAPPSLQPQQSHPHVNGYVDVPNIAERVQELLLELRDVAREAPEEHIRDLGPSAPTRDVYHQLVDLVDVSGSHKDQLAQGLGQRAVMMIYTEARTRLEVEVFVQFLNQLSAISVPTGRMLTGVLGNVEDDRIFNAPVTVCLIKTLLMDIHHVDVQTAKALSQRRPVALDFLSSLVDELVLAEQTFALRADFAASFGALSQWRSDDPSNIQVHEILAKIERPMNVPDGLPAESETADQLEYVFDEWVRLQRPDTHERTLAAFIHQLHARQIINNSEDWALLCRICIDASVEAYERQEASPIGSLDEAYVNIDAFAKLVACLVSFQGQTDGAVQGNKVAYLERILCLVVLVINHHHQSRQERFNSKVFYRFFSSLLFELQAARAHLGETLSEMFVLVAQALLPLQPQIFPGFAFAWIALLSHRMLVIPLMRSTNKQGWEPYAKLMCSLFAYLGELAQVTGQLSLVQDFYRATLRILCMIQHDYPEFLSGNHLHLSSSVPSNMVQLLNIINCANPSTFQELPDPFTPGLKINRLEQVRQKPNVSRDLDAILLKGGVKTALDQCLNGKDLSVEDVSDILHGLEASLTSRHRSALLPNAVILSIGASATIPSSAFTAAAPQAKGLESLINEASPEVRYQLISAMANQIRYPNAHTHYFSTAFLHLFAAGSEDVQQTLARVLVERLMVARPHPWGLIVTILELIKNTNYNIFEQRWMKAAPEVERMLLNIAQTQGGYNSPGR